MTKIRQFPQITVQDPTDAFLIDREGEGTFYIEAQNISSGGAAALTIGSSTIASGTSGYILYDNAGVLGNLSTIPVANGGTGTSSPGLVAGTNVTISGSWPNQTINASGGGGGGALVKISQVVTSGSQASVTFSSIPSTYTDLIITVQGRSNRSASPKDQVYIQLNGDTGSNYNSQYAEVSIDLTFNGSVNNVALYGGNIAAATASANMSGSTETTILGYANTAFYKTWLSRGGGYQDTQAFVGQYAGSWNNTAAVTSVTVYLPAIPSTFVDGSVVTLYGRG